MSPDEINVKHGRTSWRCWHCEAETGLYWWGGMSIACCRNKATCEAALQKFFDDEMQKQADQEAYEREWLGL